MGNTQSDTGPHHSHLGQQIGVGQPLQNGGNVGQGGEYNSGASHQVKGGDNIYNKMGYHVLQVQPNSPACGRLVPFFDFIVAANQVVFDKEDSRFADCFRDHINEQVHLIVYNIKSDTTRDQVVIPSNTWGGSGLAGISIRFCSWEKTLEAVWHVLDVYVNSPAHEAGLQTKTDYIVGTPDMILNEQEDFFTLINNNMYRPIQLYVYSSLTEQVRLVTITPNKNWGGSGSLGCDIGYGLLHRIPTKQSITSQFVSVDQSSLKTPPTSPSTYLPHSSSSSTSASTLTSTSTTSLTSTNQSNLIDNNNSSLPNQHQQQQSLNQLNQDEIPVEMNNNNSLNNTSLKNDTSSSSIVVEPYEVTPIKLDFSSASPKQQRNPSEFTQIQF